MGAQESLEWLNDCETTFKVGRMHDSPKGDLLALNPG